MLSQRVTHLFANLNFILELEVLKENPPLTSYKELSWGVAV